VGRRAVILAGGRGTRLAPYTLVFPKPLMPLGETPILEVLLQQLVRDGFSHVTLAVGYLSELIQSYFGDGSRLGVSIDYSKEEGPLGTAGPLRLVPGISEPFLAMNGDILSTLDYGRFLDDHISSGAAATISTYVRTHTIDFGVVETEGDRLVGYREKPTSEFNVSMGVNAISPRSLELIPIDRPFDIPDLMRALVAAGEYVRVVPFEGYWLDIGRHDDFATAQEEFATNRDLFLGPRG
jgi:NDP-mannose synthase